MSILCILQILNIAKAKKDERPLKANLETCFFHNPNTAEDTADALLKLFVAVNKGKADKAIRKAAEDRPKLCAYLPADEASMSAAV